MIGRSKPDRRQEASTIGDAKGSEGLDRQREASMVGDAKGSQGEDGDAFTNSRSNEGWDRVLEEAFWVGRDRILGEVSWVQMPVNLKTTYFSGFHLNQLYGKVSYPYFTFPDLKKVKTDNKHRNLSDSHSHLPLTLVPNSP